MKHIGNLTPAEGSTHSNKRIGRGPGSGHGGTSTRGHKGAQSRRNYKSKPGFEGGQMPLHRRLPKFGFFNRFRVENQEVNIERLQELADNNQLTGNNVTKQVLRDLHVIKHLDRPVKILGNGDIKTAFTVEADSFSASAKQKIESAGGKVIVNE